MCFLEGAFPLRNKGKKGLLRTPPFASKKVPRGIFHGSPPFAPILPRGKMRPKLCVTIACHCVIVLSSRLPCKCRYPESSPPLVETCPCVFGQRRKEGVIQRNCPPASACGESILFSVFLKFALKMWNRGCLRWGRSNIVDPTEWLNKLAYHWGQNYYIPFFFSVWGNSFGNYYRKPYSMIFLG